jgi:glycosyltransferase involved in cell wall biosynthesis
MSLRFLQSIRNLLVSELYSDKRDGDSRISFVIPVFNQEFVISEVIKGISSNCSLPIEILVLDDHSKDNSSKVSINTLKEAFKENLGIVRVLHCRSKVQLFEVMCDSILINLSNSEIVVDVQADITIKEPNFDLKIVSHFQDKKNLALLSGRGIEQVTAVKSYLEGVGSEIALGKNLQEHIFFLLLRVLRLHSAFKLLKFKMKTLKVPVLESIQEPNLDIADQLPFPSLQDFSSTGRAGRLGRLVDFEYDDLLAPDHIYMGKRYKNVVMRGPLAFRKSALTELGGLNFKAFFQGFDDSDFSVRIHQSTKWEIGYCPIGFSAPLFRGSMRKNKSILDLILLTINILRIQPFKGKSALSKFLRDSNGSF